MGTLGKVFVAGALGSFAVGYLESTIVKALPADTKPDSALLKAASAASAGAAAAGAYYVIKMLTKSK